MKVRVLKEMPSFRVGEIIDISDGDFFGTSDMFLLEQKNINNGIYRQKKPVSIKSMVLGGWLEEVKEESLFLEILKITDYHSYDTRRDAIKICEKVKEHYLEVFDKVRQEQEQGFVLDDFGKLNSIRKAIKEA